MKQGSLYRRIMWRIAYVSFCAAVLSGVLLLNRYLPPPDAGTQDITVPDLIGTVYGAPDAPSLPAELYHITLEYCTDDTAPAGMVLAQSPTAGSVRRIVPSSRPCELHLSISTGKASLSLPDLLGLPVDTARLRLGEMGLSVTVRQVLTDDYAPGQVIDMQPAIGATLQQGDTVTLSVSATKTQRTFTVPDVVGTPREVAIAALRRAGFTNIKTIYKAGALPYDTVLSQFPLGNTLISAVTKEATLTLSDGSLQPERMPSPDRNDEQNAAAEDEFQREASDFSESMPQPIPPKIPHESE